jgi:hypothetical protein
VTMPTTPATPTRGVARARVWTAKREAVLPAELSDVLYSRGFMPGFGDPEGKKPALAEAGLADAEFAMDSDGYRILSLTSSRGNGCRVWARPADRTDLPDDYLARRSVPNPRLVYYVEAGGPSNSDRNLCENIAEALMVMTNGLVEIAGLGTKGNRPMLHHSSWIGAIKAS